MLAIHRTSVPVIPALALSILLAVLDAPPSGANLIQNGSFESGPDPGEAMEVAMGSTAITGWAVTRNGIDYCGTRVSASEGTRSLSLNGTSPGGIAQSFATLPGAEYTARFFMAGDPFSSPVLKYMRATAAGQSQDYEFDATHAWPWGMGWLEKSFVFNANATSTELEFYSLDAGSTGPTLDNVVVELTNAVDVTGGALGFALAPPSPNPSRGLFRITYEVPFESPLRLGIYDLRGREVLVLAEGVHAPGRYAKTWDGRTALARAPAGLYFIRLAAPGVQRVRRALLSP